MLLLGLVLLHLDERRTAWLAILVLIPLLALLAHRRPTMRTAVVGVVVFLAAGVLAQFAPSGTLGPAESGDTATAPSDEEGGGRGGAGDQGVGNELRGTFGASDDTEQGQNANWRLDIWKFGLEESVINPAGVGFGRPMAFEWHGQRYDFRTGNPNEEHDVTGPHNDWVHFAYRMGWPALIAVFALIGIAVARVRPWLHRRARGTEDAAAAIALVGMLTSAVVFASLNDALKTPYMGIFLWILLGLMFVFPWLAREPSGPALDGTHVEVPADAPLERASNGRRRDPATAGEHA
jgi:O-antigen ligase